MDPGLIVVMAFFLIAIILTGTFVLLIPLSRQLAKFLEFRMAQKSQQLPPEIADELVRLRASVESLDEKVRSVADRQEFMEKLLEPVKSK
jgi:hypothetical protein